MVRKIRGFFTDDFLLPNLQKIWWKRLESPSTSDEAHCSQGSTETTTSDFSAQAKADCQSYLTGISHGENRSGNVDILIYEPNSDNDEVGNPISLMKIGHKERYDFWTKIAQGDQNITMMRNPTENTTQNSNGIKSYKFCHPMLLSSIIIDKNENSGLVHGDFGIFLCIPAREVTTVAADMFFCVESVSIWEKIVCRKFRKLLVKSFRRLVPYMTGERRSSMPITRIWVVTAQKLEIDFTGRMTPAFMAQNVRGLFI
mmetsp:Transcript_24582/g.37377  ORF Transcript_24582/g.37377 Transcript_24582/m.37377 type:complete len:257 (-) Transcript_24582:631-1401(-)